MARQLALGEERVAKLVAGSTIKKFIYVPGRIVNIVLGGDDSKKEEQAPAAMAETAQVIEATNQHGKMQWRARWQLARAIRARRYDRCFVLPNSAKSALIPFLAGIPQRIGHHGESRYWLLNRRLPAARAIGRPMVEFYADLADLGQREPGATDPVLVRQPARERAARERHGLPIDAPLILLCPGAEYGPAKRWPTRHFAALARLAAFEWPEACIALIGSAKERALATEIAALSGQAVHNLCGETPLADALAIVRGWAAEELAGRPEAKDMLPQLLAHSTPRTGAD
jgi:heptosyltransferase-2